MVIHTTKKSLMKYLDIPRSKYQFLERMGLIKEATNQRGKRIGYYLLTT